MSASFTNPVLAQLHNDITDPVAGTYIDYGYLYTWMPSNVPASTLAAALLAPSETRCRASCFAMAWITIEPVQTYDEQFRENYTWHNLPARRQL